MTKPLKGKLTELDKTTVSMSIRAAQQEIKLLEKRISSDLNEIELVASYNEDEPLIKLEEPEQFIAKNQATWQALNAKIARREAIQTAIMNSNVTEKITVPVFKSLDTLSVKSDETEEISVANAIRRKNYFEGVILGVDKKGNNNVGMLNMLDSRWVNAVNAIDRTVAKANDKIEASMREKMQGSTNRSEDALTTYRNTLVNRYRPKPAIAVPWNEKSSKIREAIQDYVTYLDNELSKKSELTIIEIVE